jgi:hypothetical protein
MNEFKQWFEQKLHSLGVTKLNLVEQVGYINTAKGLRRLNEFLEQPQKTHNEFIKAVCLKLSLDMDELCKKIAERKEDTDPYPEPFIQLTYPYLDTVAPLILRGYLKKLLRVDVPKVICLLPFDEQEIHLKKLADKKLSSLDKNLAKNVISFNYYTKNRTKISFGLVLDGLANSIIFYKKNILVDEMVGVVHAAEFESLSELELLNLIKAKKTEKKATRVVLSTVYHSDHICVDKELWLPNV